MDFLRWSSTEERQIKKMFPVHNNFDMEQFISLIETEKNNLDNIVLKSEKEGNKVNYKLIYNEKNELNEILQKYNGINQEQLKELNKKYKKEKERIKEKENLRKETGIIWEDSLLTEKKLKGKNFNLLETDSENEFQELVYMLNPNKNILGKVQQISEVRKSIPLVTKCRKNKDGIDTYSFKFFGDKIDARFDGHVVDRLVSDFFVYKLRDKTEDKEYFVLSPFKLQPEEYKLEGSIISMNNKFDLSKDFKLSGVTSVFFVKSFEPSIKSLSKQDLVLYIKDLGIDYNEFRSFMNWNPDQKKIFLQEERFDKFNLIQLLSGNHEGYGLNILGLSCPGTGKTTILESFLNRFEEPIFEAGNSTLKGLIPSYKESIPKLGYLIESIRFGGVDELMKLVENTLRDNKLHEVKGMFSPLNMILTKKKRMIGSGSYSSETKATAKFAFYGNPISGKRTLYENLRYLDSSTLSRMLVFCLDFEILKHKYLNKPIDRVEDNFKLNNNDFLTIYDSCQTFLSNYNNQRMNDLFKMTVDLSKDEMKGIWAARGLHHLILILDGIVKLRCLFDEDYDFKAKDCDYDELEYYAIRIIKSWDVDLTKNYMDFLADNNPDREELVRYCIEKKDELISEFELRMKFDDHKESLEYLKKHGRIDEEKKGFWRWLG